MMLIIENQLYEVAASESVEIACAVCGIIRTRKINSIRTNVRKNGRYICHTCVITSEEYLNKQYKAHPKIGRKWEQRVSVCCARCHIEYLINYRSKMWVEKHNQLHHCEFCSHQIAHQSGKYQKIYTEQFKERLRENSKGFWNGVKPGEWKSRYMVRLLQDEQYIELMRQCGRKVWLNDQFKNYMQSPAIVDKRRKSFLRMVQATEYLQSLGARSVKYWQDPTYRAIITQKTRQRMNSPAGRKLASINGQKPWLDPIYRERMAVVRANQPRVSCLQTMLYGFLRDLGVDYYEEGDRTAIGYYAFDCVIPRQRSMQRNLLIECQGDYWHTLAATVPRDKAKFTYIERYFPEHEIMYLWEHEFYTDGRILDRLKLKLGLEISTVDFEFADIQLVNDVPTKDVRAFLDAYHYIGRGRGGQTLGAYYEGQLVALGVFSSPLRQNMELHGSFRELSRFCIHPSYHKKNFASWLLARFITLVDAPRIVAYADTTVGHTGAMYKAANFVLAHEVPSDYWYVDIAGYVMHKRTLYGRASKMKLTEAQFAEEFGYIKKYGGKKLCYVLDK